MTFSCCRTATSSFTPAGRRSRRSRLTRRSSGQYELTAKPGYTGRFKLHAFERLPNGNTMVAESGNQRIIEVDKDGKIVHEIPLIVDKPSPTSDTRMVRSVPGGGYLVCHEADRKIREYDRSRQGGVGVRAGVERDARVEGPDRPRHHAVRRQAACERQHPDRRRQQQPGDRGEQGRRDRLERRGEGPARHLARVGDDASMRCRTAT